MLDPLLRAAKDRLLLPLARTTGSGVSPNAVTVATLLVGLAAAAALAVRAYPLALGLWLLNRVMDGLDGTIARAHGRQSDFGGYLDLLCDFVVYAAIPLGLAAGIGIESREMAAAAVLVAAFYVNGASWLYLSALLEKRSAGAGARGEQTTVTMPGGLVEGTETILVYCFLILFPGAAVPLMLAAAAAVAVTVLQRLAWAARHVG